MKIHLVQELSIHIVIKLQLSQENQVLQSQQLPQFFHQQLLQLQPELQLVVLTELQPLHQAQLLLQPHHLVAVVDLATAADINDRHINTKSRNQSGN